MLVGIIGAMALIAGLISLYTVGEIRERQTLLAKLPDALKTAPGERTILTGRVADGIEPLRDHYVAFVREHYLSGTKSSGGWRHLDSGRQPLVVETAAGPYKIANTDYEFDSVVPAWREIEWWANDPGISGRLRIQGLASGSPILAIGRLKPKDGENVFYADVIVGASRAEYLQRLEDGRAHQWTGTIAFLIASALGLFLGWRGLGRAFGWR